MHAYRKGDKWPKKKNNNNKNKKKLTSSVNNISSFQKQKPKSKKCCRELKREPRAFACHLLLLHPSFLLPEKQRRFNRELVMKELLPESVISGLMVQIWSEDVHARAELWRKCCWVVLDVIRTETWSLSNRSGRGREEEEVLFGEVWKQLELIRACMQAKKEDLLLPSVVLLPSECWSYRDAVHAAVRCCHCCPWNCCCRGECAGVAVTLSLLLPIAVVAAIWCRVLSTLM